MIKARNRNIRKNRSDVMKYVILVIQVTTSIRINEGIVRTIRLLVHDDCGQRSGSKRNGFDKHSSQSNLDLTQLLCLPFHVITYKTSNYY